jgi:hypothetical protein
MADGVHLRLRLIKCRAGFEPPDYAPGVVKSFCVNKLPIFRRRYRFPQLRIFGRELEFCGHHADHLRRLAVDLKRLADGVRSGPETTAP